MGVFLFLALSLSAAEPPLAPPVQAQTLQELQAKLQEIRRLRKQDDAEWKQTIRQLAAKLAEPPASASVAREAPRVAPSNPPFAADDPLWGDVAETAREGRREWIATETARLQQKHAR